MKEKLKAKYLPISFHQRMLDDWNNLKQVSKSVSEYIAKFDEYMSRCDVIEDETLTLSQFRSGLWEDLKRELILREIYTIQDTFEMVQNYDSLSTQPRRFDPNSRATTFSKPVPSSPTPPESILKLTRASQSSGPIPNATTVNNMVMFKVSVLTRDPST